MSVVLKQKEHKTEPVKNGMCKSNTGYRSILTSNELEVRPVLFIIEAGYESERCTVQVGPEKGDLKFTCSWDKHGEKYQIEEWDGSCWWVIADINVYGGLWRRFEAKCAWSKTFLKETGRGPSFIPHNGTLAEKAKRKRLERFFRYFEIPNADLDEYMSSPKVGLNLEAVPAPDNLLDHVPESCSNFEAGNRIETFEQWYEVVRVRAGKVTRKETRLLNIVYDDGVMDAEGTIKQTSQPIGKLVNSSAMYLIKIVHGAYRKNGKTHSRTIDIYHIGGKKDTKESRDAAA